MVHDIIIECQQWQSKYIDGSADKQKSVDKAIELQPLTNHDSLQNEKSMMVGQSYLIALGLEYIIISLQQETFLFVNWFVVKNVL